MELPLNPSTKDHQDPFARGEKSTFRQYCPEKLRPPHVFSSFGSFGRTGDRPRNRSCTGRSLMGLRSELPDRWYEVRIIVERSPGNAGGSGGSVERSRPERAWK